MRRWRGERRADEPPDPAATTARWCAARVALDRHRGDPRLPAAQRGLVARRQHERVDRRDVLEVLAFQDRVAGGARSVAGLIVGRQMAFPDALKQGYRDLMSRCIDACNTAYSAIRELDELLETGFGQTEVSMVSGILQELDDIEQDTDELQVNLRRTLFEMERELPPVDVMFLYNIIDRTGGIADRAQRVGSRFQLMLAK